MLDAQINAIDDWPGFFSMFEFGPLGLVAPGPALQTMVGSSARLSMVMVSSSARRGWLWQTSPYSRSSGIRLSGMAAIGDITDSMAFACGLAGLVGF
jgi:hypothetical protein